MKRQREIHMDESTTTSMNGAKTAPANQILAAAIIALFLSLLLLVGAADAHAATYEQVGVFGGPGTKQTPEEIDQDEEIQLGGVSGLAVNRTGAGGVEKGSVFAASVGSNGLYIS